MTHVIGLMPPVIMEECEFEFVVKTIKETILELISK